MMDTTKEQVINLPSAMSSLKWSEVDGPLPFVYQGKQPGSRCAWSCKWTTAGGMILPRDWIAVDDMSVEYLKWEVSDLIARVDLHSHISPQDMRVLNSFDDKLEQIYTVRKILHRVRVVYPEYVFQGNMPASVMRMVTRPGW